MRVTNGIIRQSALGHLQLGLRRVLESQEQASTGLRIRQVSDDPLAATEVIRSGSSITALAQYKRNMDAATARLGAEENALDTLGNLLSRARELATQQGSATASAATRKGAKAEIDELLKSAISLGNTRHTGEYLFGGVQSQTAPFGSTVPPFAATAPAGTREAEISSGVRIPVNHDGTEIFLDTGALQALHDLSTALGADDAEGIRASIGGLSGAFDGVQRLLADVGARAQQLEVTSANIDALDGQIRALRSNLQEADIEQTVTELVSRQTAYQAAMLATSRVIGLNLADYLR